MREMEVGGGEDEGGKGNRVRRRLREPEQLVG